MVRTLLSQSSLLALGDEQFASTRMPAEPELAEEIRSEPTFSWANKDAEVKRARAIDCSV